MPPPSPRQTLRLDSAWLFHRGDIDAPFSNRHIAAYMADKAGFARGPARPSFDDSAWRSLDLPHDWSVEGPFDQANHVSNGFLPRGIAWYRRHFALDDADRARRLHLQFDGVTGHCTAYLNGHLLHRHFSAYTPFIIDFTDVASFGPRINTLAVRVDANPVTGWWYEGAGIYRHVWLLKTDPVHVAPYGIFIRPSQLSAESWEVSAEATVENSSDSPAAGEVTFCILDSSGAEIAAASIPFTLAARSSASQSHAIPVHAPQLWSPSSPTRYHVRTEIRVAGRVVDQIDTPFGFRTFRFDPAHGFFLNGQPLKLLGTCNHQDHAGVGVAVPDSLHEFRIRRLQDMGCNAYRCAHNPPAPEFLDACDRLGMLVIDENRSFGSSPDHLSHLRTMVLRDRNHPSVILWSLCNEESIQGTPVAARIARTMAHAVRQLDPSRPVTAAVSGGILNDDALPDALDVVGINYQLRYHDLYHARHPDTSLLAAETQCVLSTRGIYRTDPEAHLFASYDEDVAPWGNSARDTWRILSSRPFVAGLFPWTGFDYRGEPTPSEWRCINSHFGLLDTCGFPKDGFFLQKAYYRPDHPFVHLLPHWTWPGREGHEIHVAAYTTCDAVELFLDQRSLGRRPVDPIEMASWQVPYEPGVLRAVGYRRNEAVAETIVETTGDPVAIGLEVQPSAPSGTLAADGCFALPITAFALDAHARRVPTASNHLTFTVTGPASILGVGNGDPRCHEPDKASSRSLFNGLAQVILQTTTRPGPILLTATSPGLRPASLELLSHPVDLPPTVPFARYHHFLSEWRMSPITAAPPDPTQEMLPQDMNSWEHVEPGRGPQPAWQSAAGFALYRTTFTPPPPLQSRGGRLLFHEILGSCDVFLDGCKIAAKSSASTAPLEVSLPPSSKPLTLVLLLHASFAPAGLSGLVELLPPE